MSSKTNSKAVKAEVKVSDRNPNKQLPSLKHGFFFTAPSTQDTFDNEILQGRILQAEIFLHQTLYPYLDKTEHLDQAVLVDLIVDFRERNLEMMNAFELATVLGRVINHLENYLSLDLDSNWAPPDFIEKDMLLIEIFSNIDFEKVDAEVNSFDNLLIM